MSVCQVDCGDKGSYQILCGASNVAADMFVPVALPGAYLPAIDLKIEKRTLRGLDSNGMICAKAELAISEDTDQPWIWILTEDFDDLLQSDLGVPLAKKYPRLQNRIMDVDNKGLTHRPDLTGHFGLAMELSVMYSDAGISGNISSLLKNFSDINILELLDSSTSSTRKLISESDALRSYILVDIPAVQVKNSSFFTRLQLLDLGLASRSNWVDFSNLFMVLTGQPVHFFDADKVDGDVIVRYAQDGEKFLDLFEVEHELKSTELVIADRTKILALAGVV